jgi:CRP-like cAMP-binding protein
MTIEEENYSPENKVKISTIQYFWQVSPLGKRQGQGVPNFLRKISVLKNFTENELRVLSNYLHRRTFAPKSIVFKEGEAGFGFYFVFDGNVSLYMKNDKGDNSNLITILEKNDYFGELALLQENSIRSASCITDDGCTLLGIFKPDLEELLECNPRIAAKLLQSVSIIISERLGRITTDLKVLKEKLAIYEDAKQD